MPPKAMDKNAVDDMLCELMPKDLSKASKMTILNDTTLKGKNMAFEYNYNQLSDVASSIDITNDYALMAIHAYQCIESLKSVFK